MADRVPLVLKLEHWPQSDRALWVAITADGGFLEDGGAGANWARGTRRFRLQGYGQWLSYLMRVEPTALSDAPIKRVTEVRVRGYLEEMGARLKPSSQANLMVSLLVIMKAANADGHWDWLERAANRLTNALSSNSVPTAKPITARQVFQPSLTRLRSLMAQTTDAVPALRQAIHFRQSLMIAFLVARPVRRRALLAMEVNRHVVRRGDGFHLFFEAEDMKDKKTRDYPLPAALTVPMQVYLDMHRPILLGGKQTASLWVSQFGEAMTADGLSRELPKVTERLIGVALRPHAFRHIAATSIAETDPEHVGIIKDILGHKTLVMSEKHYNRATGISGCNALQSIVEDTLANVPTTGRASRDHRDRGRR